MKTLKTQSQTLKAIKSTAKHHWHCLHFNTEKVIDSSTQWAKETLSERESEYLAHWLAELVKEQRNKFEGKCNCNNHKYY